jgi:oligosaccharyltransferase complex subunit epsilon
MLILLCVCVQPFNAFLSGFSAAVGQFVLTASLRLQTVERAPASSSSSSAAASKRASKTGDTEVGESGDSRVASSERAFADFVFGSLILHGFCVNFIN